LHKTSLQEVRLWDYGKRNCINVQKIQECIDDLYSLEDQDQVQVDDKALPSQTVELYGLEALKKIGEMCFGFFPMNYHDHSDYRIHHCALDLYFRTTTTEEQVSE
jgi:hypothetical protein